MSQRDNHKQSVTGRLRERFGSEVDPQVSIALNRPGTEFVSEEEAAATPGILERLGEHAAPQTRYRVAGEIARGGMGMILEVWDEDLRRPLAMKMALGSTQAGAAEQEQPGATPRVLARFLEEAQVTGQLDHPGIVPVHELGLDAKGQAYFTMRLVQGRDLEHILDLVDRGQDEWTVTRALGVLLKACEALAYAHDKGVIHRDLKPGNLMVGSFGEVYVMDWGLAHVQEHEDLHVLENLNLTDTKELKLLLDKREDHTGGKTEELYTVEGDVIGTPAYMPPEQARGKLAAMSARSDVYSMGALLYRLLAGSPPYLPKGVQRSPMEILKDLWEGPPAPLESLAPEAPTELVAICEKAMQREPADRYPDMLALAEDLRAFLENRVVQAYETGAWAESRKWVRRNKPLAASMAAGVLALILGLVASLILKGRADANAVLASTRASEAKESALAAKASSEEAARQARVASEVNRFLNDELLASASPFAEGVEVTVAEVLDKASRSLDGRFAEEPQVEAELRKTIGRSYQELGHYERAESQLERALELFRREQGEAGESTLLVTASLAHIWTLLGRLDDAQEQLAETLKRAETSLGREHPVTLETHAHQARNWTAQGEHEQARAGHDRVYQSRKLRLGGRHPEALAALAFRGNAERRLGLLPASLASLEAAVDGWAAVASEENGQLLMAKNNLAVTLTDLGRYEEAEARYLEVLAVQERVFGPEHPEAVKISQNLALVYLRQNRPEEALRLLRESAQALANALGEDHPDTLNAIDGLVVALQNTGQLTEALERSEALVDTYHRVLGPEHDRTLLARNNLAATYLRLGRRAEAKQLYEEVHLLYVENLGALHPKSLVAYENLGGVLYQLGDFAGSLAIAEEVLEGREVTLGTDHPTLIQTRYNIAMNRSRLGDAQGAEDMFHDVVSASRLQGEAQPITASALGQLARLRSAAADHVAAGEHYREALIIHRARGDLGAEGASLLHQLGLTHFYRQEHAQAVSVFEEALAVSREIHGTESEATLSTLSMLVKCRIEAGLLEGTEELALEFHAIKLAAHGPNHRHVQVGRQLLAELYDALGQPEKAADWK